jgi:tRNA 2-selenouridine synthase
MIRPDTDNYLDLFLNDRPMIDTRAPVEFARGAFDGAVNLPLMSDEERHLVGTRYKEAGQDAAIELGRELVSEALQAQRSQQWKDFADSHPGGYLYCFRGGLRSRITQQWMAEVGVEYPYIKGGYKAMRRFLIERFAGDCAKTNLVLISGRTGTGKTLLLNRILRSIDLENLANHRGSSFGPMQEPQPTPINFENRLSVAMLKLMHESPQETIFLEGEGRQVGSLSLPPVLWSAMSEAPTLVLETSMERRLEIGIEDYVVDLLRRIQLTRPGAQGFDCFADRHRHSLFKIRKRLGGVRFSEAGKMLESAFAAHRRTGSTEGYKPFIQLLLEHYYDPMYDYQLAQRKTEVLATGDADQLMAWLRQQHVAIR